MKQYYIFKATKLDVTFKNFYIMKKLFLILIFLGIIQSCSDSSDDSEKTEIPASVTISQSLKGIWKVNYYNNITTGDYHSINDKGYYINFLENNTIKIKDVNGEFLATPYYSQQAANFVVYSNIDNTKQIYLEVQNYSNYFQGNYEFTITYNNNYNSMKFFAKKQ